MAKTVLIIATDGYERVELEGPKSALTEAGIEVKIASIKTGEIKSWDMTDWGDSEPVDLQIADIKIEDYAALLLPGGVMNPDVLRTEPAVLDVIRAFDSAKKPIAAICHAPWLLTDAGVAQGRTITSWKSIRNDLRNAGAEVADKEVQIDGNLITSRSPDDVPVFSQALIKAVNEA